MWKAERKRKERKLTAGQPSVSPVSATEDEAEVEGLWFDGGEQESMGTSKRRQTMPGFLKGSIWGWGRGGGSIIVIIGNIFESNLGFTCVISFNSHCHLVKYAL